MTIEQFWQAAYLAVLAKQGAGTDAAAFAAGKAVEDYRQWKQDDDKRHPDKEP